MDPLRDIFGVSTAELFRKKELFVTHGPLERFPAFMRKGPMESIDALTRHYSGPLEVSQGSARDGVQIQVSGAHASALLRLGVTVFFTDMHRALPEAPAFLRALEAALGVPECSTLSAFVNAPGSGLAVHHDRFDQLFFQIRGNKEFRFAPNGFVENPDVPTLPSGRLPATPRELPKSRQCRRHARQSSIVGRVRSLLPSFLFDASDRGSERTGMADAIEEVRALRARVAELVRVRRVPRTAR